MSWIGGGAARLHRRDHQDQGGGAGERQLLDRGPACPGHEAGVPSVAKMATVTPTPIDVDPPETRFTDKPAARTRRREVVFTYTSDESGSTFECKLDQKPFNPCGPQRRLRVSSGLHTFRVRAIDRAGNVDPTPAVRQFRVTRRSEPEP